MIMMRMMIMIMRVMMFDGKQPCLGRRWVSLDFWGELMMITMTMIMLMMLLMMLMMMVLVVMFDGKRSCLGGRRASV